MADRIIIINGVPVKLIPLGYCACGCGGKTNVNRQTDRAKGLIKGQHKKFIRGHNGKGESHHAWKGGRKKGRYPSIYCPGHHKASGNHVHEHILIAEKALGKDLPPKAIVHHHDISQLVICQDQAYHFLLHRRQRALKACGNVHWRKCVYCKKHDDPINLVITNGNRPHHRICAAKYKIKLMMRSYKF